MTNQQDPQLGAEAEKEKSVLPLGMLVVIEFHGVLVKEDRLGLGEGYAVLALVLPFLCLVPFESQQSHNYNVGML